MSIGIPFVVEHLDAGGRLLARASRLADASTEPARLAFGHLDAYTRFVHERVPEALAQVRDGLRLIIDERMVDDAVGGRGSVTLGRAGTRFLSEPIESPVVVAHELTHGLGLDDGNYLVDELNADLVGLAYGRATGAAPTPEDAWRIGMVGRDLRQPEFATVEALKASTTTDTHLMAGPIGAAVARASDSLGIDVVDGIAVEAALRVVPRSSAAVRARIDDLIWSGRPTAQIEAAIVDLAMTDHAEALLTAAARRHGRSSDAVAVLRQQLRNVGVAVD